MSHNSSSSNDRNVEPANEDALVKEKERLLQDIQKLKCIVKRCKLSLQMRFKDVEERVTKKQSSKNVTRHKPSNVDVDFQTDLYRFAGLRCVEFRKNEFIFNFTSTNSKQKANTYAIQIFIKDGKANLGKWVMPMSIDMNQILSKTPLELKNITAFIKNCKHHVDCYTARQEQFLSLKKRTSNMKQCNLQSDIGFMSINLELYGVHDKENDKYINLAIYLLYYSDKVRPYKIEVGTTNNSKLSDDMKQKLKMCLKEFKISDLQIAFDKILKEDNSIFTWMRTDDSESPLELNDTSNSDEEDFLVHLQSDRKRSLRKLKKKRELQKKWNKRKRQRNIRGIESPKDSQEENSHPKTKISRTESPRRIPIREKKAEKAKSISGIESLEDSQEEDSQPKAKVSRTESPRQIPIREKKAEKVKSISKQNKINKNLLEETTPRYKPKNKLKQTKLNFQTHETTISNTNEVTLFKSKQSNSEQLEAAKLITSTPLDCSVNLRRIKLLSPTLEINNITSIETTRKTANKLDNSKNSDQLDNEKTQKRNDRLLRSGTKTTGSSPKTNKRLTRSMTKS